MAIFRAGQTEFNKCIMTITQKACEWIELDIKNYQLTVQSYMEDETKRTKIQESDTSVRLALEDTPITDDVKVFIAASKFKFQRDMEMFRKMQAIRLTTSQQAQQEVQNIEMSKTSDALFVEYGFDLSTLVRASKQFKLDDNQELKSFRKIVIAQKESEEKAEFDRAQPPKHVVDAICREGTDLGAPQYK